VDPTRHQHVRQCRTDHLASQRVERIDS
jgi:hypothetical protein